MKTKNLTPSQIVRLAKLYGIKASLSSSIWQAKKNNNDELAQEKRQELELVKAEIKEIEAEKVEL